MLESHKILNSLVPFTRWKTWRVWGRVSNCSHNALRNMLGNNYKYFHWIAAFKNWESLKVLSGVWVWGCLAYVAVRCLVVWGFLWLGWCIVGVMVRFASSVGHAWFVLYDDFVVFAGVARFEIRWFSCVYRCGVLGWCDVLGSIWLIGAISPFVGPFWDFWCFILLPYFGALGGVAGRFVFCFFLRASHGIEGRLFGIARCWGFSVPAIRADTPPLGSQSQYK